MIIDYQTVLFIV